MLGAPTMATLLISTPPALKSAAAMAAPSAAPTASRTTPPSARRSSRHTAPSHPSSTIDASTPTNPDQRSWSFLSVTNFTILAAESFGLGGLPGRKAAISINTTNTMPASASERSDLRSSTSPPLGGAAPGRWCLLPESFASIVRFAGASGISTHLHTTVDSAPPSHPPGTAPLHLHTTVDSAPPSHPPGTAPLHLL